MKENLNIIPDFMVQISFPDKKTLTLSVGHTQKESP